MQEKEVLGWQLAHIQGLCPGVCLPILQGVLLEQAVERLVFFLSFWPEELVAISDLKLPNRLDLGRLF